MPYLPGPNYDAWLQYPDGRCVLCHSWTFDQHVNNIRWPDVGGFLHYECVSVDLILTAACYWPNAPVRPGDVVEFVVMVEGVRYHVRDMRVHRVSGDLRELARVELRNTVPAHGVWRDGQSFAVPLYNRTEPNAVAEEVSPDALRVLLTGPTDGAAEADGVTRGVVFDTEGGFREI